MARAGGADAAKTGVPGVLATSRAARAPNSSTVG